MNPYVDKANELGCIQVYANLLASGQWRDESGNGHHATLFGAVLESSGGPATNLTHRLFTDGNDDYARVPHDSQIDFGPTDSGSHMVWVWIPSGFGDSDAFAPIFSKSGSGYEFRKGSGDELRWDPRAGTGLFYDEPPKGEWLCFCVTVSPTNATTATRRIWQRRASEETFSVVAEQINDTSDRSNYQSNSNPFHFGSRAAATPERFFNGYQAGYAAFKNKVLTLSEMNELYDSAFAEIPAVELAGASSGEAVLSGRLPTFGGIGIITDPHATRITTLSISRRITAISQTQRITPKRESQRITTR